MQVPFQGFEIPSLLYLFILFAGAVTVFTLLYVTRPPVTQQTVLALVPWMISGSILHVFFQLGELFQRQVYPVWAEPLFAAPAVYVTTFISAGTVWVIATIISGTASGGDRTSQYLGAMGIGVLVPLVGLVIWQGLDPTLEINLIIPIVALIATGVLTFIFYVLLGTWRTYVIAEARIAGALVLFAHLLDGVTTAIGRDVFGVEERSRIPARIMDFAADLPTATYIGEGWLFVVVKLLVATVIVVTFADYVQEEPTRGNLLFAAVTAVGLGPAMNNFFLFMLGAGF